MACINPDGTISNTAKALLQNLSQPLTAEEIAKVVNQPLFKVRGSLREMVAAGFVEIDGDKYSITPAGKEKA